jgi:hypothetical protein
MGTNDFTATFTVDQTPAAVFAAVNHVRGWWSGEIEGRTDHLGAEFSYRYGDVHFSRQVITECTPDSRVVWHVVDSYLDFVEDKAAWTGSDISFDITPIGDRTEVRFTHLGLTPDDECFDGCSSAWSFYVNSSLRDLITAGVGHPNPTATSESGQP